MSAVKGKNASTDDPQLRSNADCTITKLASSYIHAAKISSASHPAHRTAYRFLLALESYAEMII